MSLKTEYVAKGGGPVTTITVAHGGYQSTLRLASQDGTGRGFVHALERVAHERVGQLTREGYTVEGDSRDCAQGQLARAAFAYAGAAECIARGNTPEFAENAMAMHWPREWDPAMFKPYDSDNSHPLSDQLRCLEKAGALILAEIQRVQDELTADELCAADERRAEGE